MLTTMNMVLKMQAIKDVQRGPDSVSITLRDGSIALLDLNYPNFANLIICVESELRRHRPVGLVMDTSGRIIDIGAAHDTQVRSVVQFPNDPSRFQVGFWAYSPVCGLTRDQPEFERILATLTEAVKTMQMVWVVTHSRDVVEDVRDEDGLIPAYPKILDVRPDPSPLTLVNGDIQETSPKGL